MGFQLLAFSHFEINDSNFKTCSSRDEWDRVEKLRKLLNVFYDITCVFSKTKYPTANLYFPSVFMACITLQEHMSRDDMYMKTIATEMFHKFDKY
ncbi:hypothetical protein SCA6_011302 [Theobroma cacao]